jgi:hypothetical protein
MNEKQRQEEFLDQLVAARGVMEKVLEACGMNELQLGRWLRERKFFKAFHHALECVALIERADLMLQQRQHTRERSARLDKTPPDGNEKQRKEDFDQNLKSQASLQRWERLAQSRQRLESRQKLLKAKAAVDKARQELEQIGPRAHPDVPPARVKQLLDEMERVDRYCG